MPAYSALTRSSSSSMFRLKNKATALIAFAALLFLLQLLGWSSTASFSVNIANINNSNEKPYHLDDSRQGNNHRQNTPKKNLRFEQFSSSSSSSPQVVRPIVEGKGKDSNTDANHTKDATSSLAPSPTPLLLLPLVGSRVKEKEKIEGAELQQLSEVAELQQQFGIASSSPPLTRFGVSCAEYQSLGGDDLDFQGATFLTNLRQHPAAKSIVISPSSTSSSSSNQTESNNSSSSSSSIEYNNSFLLLFLFVCPSTVADLAALPPRPPYSPYILFTVSKAMDHCYFALPHHRFSSSSSSSSLHRSSHHYHRRKGTSLESVQQECEWFQSLLQTRRDVLFSGFDVGELRLCNDKAAAALPGVSAVPKDMLYCYEKEEEEEEKEDNKDKGNRHLRHRRCSLHQRQQNPKSASSFIAAETGSSQQQFKAETNNNTPETGVVQQQQQQNQEWDQLLDFAQFEYFLSFRGKSHCGMTGSSAVRPLLEHSWAMFNRKELPKDTAVDNVTPPPRKPTASTAWSKPPLLSTASVQFSRFRHPGVPDLRPSAPDASTASSSALLPAKPIVIEFTHYDQRPSCPSASPPHDYWNLLLSSAYSLVLRGDNRWSYRFVHAVQACSIPVVLSDGWQLPFSPIIDWEGAGVIVLPEEAAKNFSRILAALPTDPQEIQRRRDAICRISTTYFDSFDRRTQAYIDSVRKVTKTRAIRNVNTNNMKSMATNKERKMDDRGGDGEHGVVQEKVFQSFFTTNNPRCESPWAEDAQRSRRIAAQHRLLRDRKSFSEEYLSKAWPWDSQCEGPMRSELPAWAPCPDPLGVVGQQQQREIPPHLKGIFEGIRPREDF